MGCFVIWTCGYLGLTMFPGNKDTHYKLPPKKRRTHYRMLFSTGLEAHDSVMENSIGETKAVNSPHEIRIDHCLDR